MNGNKRNNGAKSKSVERVRSCEDAGTADAICARLIVHGKQKYMPGYRTVYVRGTSKWGVAEPVDEGGIEEFL